ncbi:MAG: hypothetical protein ACPLIG_00060 [Candidatus Bathyarchaeales archaeon]
MQKNLPLKPETNNQTLPETHTPAKCCVCNQEYNEPLFAAIASGYLIEEYYACPRCLSRIGNIESSKIIEPEEAEEAKQEEPAAQKSEIEEKSEGSAVCAHHLGYLKHRPKNTPIPEECFTCGKMIECMT